VHADRVLDLERLDHDGDRRLAAPKSPTAPTSSKLANPRARASYKAVGADLDSVLHASEVANIRLLRPKRVGESQQDVCPFFVSLANGLPTPTVLEATKRLQVLHVALARDGFERFLCVRSCEVNNVKHY